MISFNFLGLGSFTAAQQKGKTNGVMNADSENGSASADGDSQPADTAFPNVLMQIVLGQQLPPTGSLTTKQTSLIPETTVDGEVSATDKPLFTSEQELSLREKLFAGELKKQIVIQKTEIQTSASPEAKALTSVSKNVEPSTFLLEGLAAEPESATPQIQDGIVEPSPSALGANNGVININPTQPQLNLGQLTSSIFKEEGKSGVKMRSEEINHIAPQLPLQQEVSKNIVPNKKMDPLVNNLTMNEIVQPSLENTAIYEESDKKINAEFLKATMPSNAADVKQSSFQPKKVNNTKPNEGEERTSLTTKELKQKGILSAVVTQGGKTAKVIANDSTISDKSNHSEKQSSIPSSVEIDKPLTGVLNEMQNSGNSTFSSKENLERQALPEKDIASIDNRHGQQTFAAVVEEKNISVVSKTHQAEVSSILRHQETVNNIVEQLAKNVTVSLHENNSHIKISLNPEALGEVMLKVSIEQGKVSTQMEVQQPQVKAAIEANIQVLRESLSNKGLVVDRIDVSTGQFSLNEKSSHQGQQRSSLKNYSGKEIDNDITAEQVKLFGYNTVDYVA